MEFFFSCIRSRGGWNNNPNTQQLKWALRQLLYRNSVTPSVSANCSDLESYCTPAFEFRSEDRQFQDVLHEVTNKNGIDNLLNCLNENKLSEFQENVVFYIAGYIVCCLVNATTCSHCIEILTYKSGASIDHSYSTPTEAYKSFTNFVTRGGLVYASDVVYKIVHFAEKQISLLLQNKFVLKSKINLKQKLINIVINNFVANMNLFQPTHPVVQEFVSEECHEIQIMRKIVDIYMKCRMFHHSKLLNLKLHGNSATVRQKMTKLILFSNC